MTKNFIISFLFFLPVLAFGQKIITKIVCYENGERVPEVWVWEGYTKVKNLTNFEGTFSMELDSLWNDTIYFHVLDGNIKKVEYIDSNYQIIVNSIIERILAVLLRIRYFCS